MKLAAAPISWGVCEVPNWGYQLPREKVLADAAQLGLRDIETGPPGFLPDDDADARAFVDARGLRVVAAFVTAVLHQAGRLEGELASLDRQAARLAALGGEVLVLACATGATGEVGYDQPAELSAEEWAALGAALPRVMEVAARHRLRTALHPHVGTVVESAASIDRVLRTTEAPLCLDTGHVFVGGGDPVGIARERPERIAHVHLKDADATLAAAVRERRVGYAAAVKRGLFRPLGAGDARIAEVLAALREARYGGWAVLEQDIALDAPPGEGSDPVRDVIRSRDFALAHG